MPDYILCALFGLVLFATEGWKLRHGANRWTPQTRRFHRLCIGLSIASGLAYITVVILLATANPAGKQTLTISVATGALILIVASITLRQRFEGTKPSRQIRLRGRPSNTHRQLFASCVVVQEQEDGDKELDLPGCLCTGVCVGKRWGPVILTPATAVSRQELDTTTFVHTKSSTAIADPEYMRIDGAMNLALLMAVEGFLPSHWKGDSRKPEPLAVCEFPFPEMPEGTRVTIAGYARHPNRPKWCERSGQIVAVGTAGECISRAGMSQRSAAMAIPHAEAPVAVVRLDDGYAWPGNIMVLDGQSVLAGMVLYSEDFLVLVILAEAIQEIMCRNQVP